MRRVTHAATIAFLAMLGFQVALAAGAPLGHAAWGGAHAHLSTAQRVGSAVSVAFYALAILVVRRRAAGRTERRHRWATLGLVGILGLSGLMNVASSSPWERYMLAPVALALAVLCAVVAHKATTLTAPPAETQQPSNVQPLMN
jgi:heme A synthase